MSPTTSFHLLTNKVSARLLPTNSLTSRMAGPSTETATQETSQHTRREAPRNANVMSPYTPRQQIEATRIGPYILGKTLGVGSTGISIIIQAVLSLPSIASETTRWQ
jgi:hypothetical protein